MGLELVESMVVLLVAGMWGAVVIAVIALARAAAAGDQPLREPLASRSTLSDA